MRESADRPVKIVRQYNKEPVAEEDMEKLLEIAADYRTVKNYVYQRYGGIDSLSKLYPGYTVQNEMTESGLREKLQMPSVYFYLAIFDALGDIKTQWSRVRNLTAECIRKHESLTGEEKHYLRFVLKSDDAWDAVLHCREVPLSGSIRQKYDAFAETVDTHRLHQYLRRQTRRHLKKMHTDKADSFSIGERAYRYGDGGIYISVKQKRQRIYVPLTDHNSYTRQLKVMLYPQEGRLEIMVPVRVRTRKHEDYTKETGISLGIHTMLTASSGNRYGEELGVLLKEKADWLREQNRKYREQRSRDANPIGRSKYQKQKQKIDAGLHTYINEQLNCFLRAEKPAVIYMAKLPPNSYGGSCQSRNYMTTIWERGYIRDRLSQKCRENNIRLVEVYAKNISNECSDCGAVGKKKEGCFYCSTCGMKLDEKVNAAKNAKKRGESNRS